MIATQMSTSGIGEHVSGRLCVQNLPSWGSIHSAMKKSLSGPWVIWLKEQEDERTSRRQRHCRCVMVAYVCITLRTSPRTPVLAYKCCPKIS